MKILVLGNLGYIGPALVRELAERHSSASLHGLDNAYFAHCLTGATDTPERYLAVQYYGDVRDVTPDMLRGYDTVVQLAAVSNDPMGNRFAAVTADINQKATVSIAMAAAAAGVRSYVFASSCSIYGVAEGAPRNETDPTAPMTAYARSKIGSEQELERLDTDMVVTCLRFATACGMSDRLRLDLVLNDFVACALTSGRITVLSDGSPWRPLIDVADMARAIDWAVHRPVDNGGQFLRVNTGSDGWNYQVRDLANAVAEAIPGTSVSINTDAPVDSRSYKVDFSLFRDLAPEHQPQVTLPESIGRLVEGLKRMNFTDAQFRQGPLMRLQVLQGHIAEGRLSEDLRWQ
jgi:nucleoside-diphosphate-sugar epimerase